MTRRARLDLVLDCAEPERLMPFWRDALGYRVLLGHLLKHRPVRRSPPRRAALRTHRSRAHPRGRDRWWAAT